MYELDEKKHKNLIEKCLAGKVSLFTGAGFSIGAKVKTENVPSTMDLIHLLLTDFAEISDEKQRNRIIQKKSFQQICQYVINEKSESSFNEFITRIFSNCRPTEFQKLYKEIDWNEIFTTNIDDIIENIYSLTDIEIQSINTRKQPDEYIGENILKYYKLHGDVRNKSEGFIFSKKQYIDTIISEKINYPILKFSEALYKDTFCFIGTNFDEIDIEKYISQFQKANGETLPKNKIYYIKRTVYPEDVSELESKNIVPIQESAESFIKKLLEYKSKIEEPEQRESNIKIVKKVSIEKKFENLGFDYIKQNTDLIDEEEKNNHKPIDFYLGYSPRWIDIATNSDAILDYTNNTIKQIENNDGFNLFVTIGKSGNGKTTSLKRILYNFSMNDEYLVLEHKDLFEINNNIVSKLVSIINSEDKHIIIGFDNGSWSLKYIEYIYSNLHTDSKVSFIVTTRYPEYYRERTYITGIPKEIQYIDDNLTKENALKIVTILEKKGYLGKLINLKDNTTRVEELMKIKTENKDLFSCLINATEGKGFFERINEHIDISLEDNNIKLKLLILLAILDRFGSLPLSKSIFYNVFKNDIENLNDTLHSMSDILDKNSLSSDKIRLRGEYATVHILKKIFNYLTQEELFKIITNILIYTSTLFDVDKRKKRNYKTELSSILLNSRHYLNYLKINDKKLFDQFYTNLKNYYNNLSPFWLYYAKMEMKLDSLDSAWVHLQQAEALNNSYEIEHTIGQWHLISARNQDTYEDAIIEFQYGEEVMLKQINMKQDAYPVHTYIDEYIFFNKKFKNKIHVQKIKSLVSIINDARETFNDQIIIQIIWKKFYNFLKETNYAEFMPLSLEDVKTMKKINTKRSAEEQYLQLIKNNFS